MQEDIKRQFKKFVLSEILKLNYVFRSGSQTGISSTKR